jgi:hypothetical protein
MAKSVPLPSPLVSLQPNTPRIDVGPGGTIDPKQAPARFLIGQRESEIVVWVVLNHSGQPITVTLTDFMLKKSMMDAKGKVPVKCLRWLASEATQVDPGAVGFIGGFIDPDYKIQGAMFDHLSYTIQVRSRATTNPFADVDYDPDGDIKP